MVKKYELVLILDPQVGDTQLEAAAEKYKAQLEATGAAVANVDNWGLRKLAYTSMALRQRQQAFYLLYQFEVRDPTVWTDAWSGEYVWPRSPDKLFEYACHEGNYALGNILRGARLLEDDRRASRSP